MINLTIKNFSNSDELHRYFTEYDRGDNFSPTQMQLIYDLFTEAAPNSVIDVIGICCEFSGYSSIKEAMKDLGYKNVRDLEYNCIVYRARNGEVVVQH